MNPTIEYISKAVKAVFGHDQSKFKMANDLVSKFSGNIPEMLKNLDKLCRCDFSSKASLGNVVATQAVANNIGELIAKTGVLEVSSDIAIKTKIGSANLNTQAKDLSSGLNEVNTKAALSVTNSATAQAGVNSIKNELGSATLTTTLKTVKAAINEVNTKAALAIANSATAQNGVNSINDKLGSAALATNAQTVKAAINEVNTKAALAIANSATAQTGVNSINDKLGSAALATNAQTVKAAINELDAEMGSESSQVGILGSFYSCTSLDDTNPTLIAAGSSTIKGRDIARQKCDNWAFLKEFTTVNSKITTGSLNSEVYVSISSSGSCFNAIGDLQTLPVMIFNQWSDAVLIPAIEINCIGSACTTVETEVVSHVQHITIPSLIVTCVNAVCTTPETTVTSHDGDPEGKWYEQEELTIPSLTVGFIDPTAGSLSAMCKYYLDH